MFIFSNAYNSYVLKGITTAAKKHNNDVIFSFAEKKSFASLYLKNLTDGLIILNHREDDRDRIIELEERTIIKNCSLRKNYAFKIMKKILKEPNPPTAVISGLTDTFILGLIQAIYSAGMKFPKDISGVTLGGSDSIADIRPTLAAIKMPWVDLGKKAIQMLMKVIDGVKLRKNHVVLPSELIINESTAAPRDK